MAASYVIAGFAEDPKFAETEILADLMARSLPEFKVKKVMKSKSEWAGWLATECADKGFKHESSPLVYRLLGEGNPAGALLNGGPSLLRAPRFVGDDIAFRLMAAKSYGLAPVIDQDEIDRVITTNVQLAAADPLTNRTTYATVRTVAINEAASPTAYQLLWRIARGDVFGADTAVHIRLLDCAENQDVLGGVAMELDDLAVPNVASVGCFADMAAAVDGADSVVLFTGAIGTRSDAAETTDAAVGVAKAAGAALAESLLAKVLLIGQNCNGAAAVLAALAPNLTKSISTLTALPEARARACIAAKLSGRVDADDLRITGANIQNVVVWGGDSAMPVVDVSNAMVTDFGATVGEDQDVELSSVLRDSAFTGPDGESQRELSETPGTLLGGFKPRGIFGWIRDRDAAMTKAKGGSGGGGPAMLTAKTAAAQLVAQFSDGVTDKYYSSVGVESTGNSYGVPDGVFFSFPVTADGEGGFAIVAGLEIDEQVKAAFEEAAAAALTARDACLITAGLPIPQPEPEPEPEPEPAAEVEVAEVAGDPEGDGAAEGVADATTEEAPAEEPAGADGEE